jgi:hypothetical protein
LKNLLLIKNYYYYYFFRILKANNIIEQIKPTDEIIGLYENKNADPTNNAEAKILLPKNV